MSDGDATRRAVVTGGPDGPGPVVAARLVSDGLAVSADLRDEPQVLVQIVTAQPAGPLGEISGAAWDATAMSPLREVFLAGRAAVDPMIRAGWGRIITVAAGNTEATVLAGLAGFTATVALELAPLGITAHLIAGGSTEQVAATVSFLLGDVAPALSGQTLHRGHRG